MKTAIALDQVPWGTLSVGDEVIYKYVDGRSQDCAGFITSLLGGSSARFNIIRIRWDINEDYVENYHLEFKGAYWLGPLIAEEIV